MTLTDSGPRFTVVRRGQASANEIPETSVRMSIRAGAVPIWKTVPGFARSSSVRSKRGAPKRFEDSRHVRGVRPHPDVEISRGSRIAVCGEGVSADDEELSSGRGEFGQHLDEVAVHRGVPP
jgi:hypothetical protein